MFDDFDGAFYERHMPHYQPAEAEFHVMFRLYRSLPIEAIEQMRAERTKLEKEFIEAKREGRKLDGRDFHAAYFAKFDKLLSGATTGPTWLGVDKVARLSEKRSIFGMKKNMTSLHTQSCPIMCT